ncbi:NAD(P)/FAD-dependent oxidoreductase [Luteimicrobium subarcticum]|uniref:NADH dehydrogenase n=1 Tax=Luteimicrobium subarcticum TaxID=620910 RepID=A0A2M8WTC6_9MICO|nr:FAD-dependent oxidoreductase [Luteimicrobium subarcticum]PJI94139.1 NADH dehydrogenase [Luteimicrobium subarcticum]
MPQNDLTPVSPAQSSGSSVPRILVLGGGSVGLYAARRLRKRLGRGEARITIVDTNPYLTYAPFLPEAAAGSIESRYVVAPLRKALPGVEVVEGKVTSISHADKSVTVEPEEGEPFRLTYDQVVVALGSVARLLPIPGLAEQGIGLKTVEEAIAVRNHVLNRIDVASSAQDDTLKARLLTFTFIGGGFAGIEAIAEVEDMARAAVKKHPTLQQSDLRFVMIEGTGRILPELSEPMALYALEQLKDRGIEFHLSTFLSSCEDGHVVTSTGVEFDSDTIVWTAGIKSNPVVGQSDLPLDKLGRLQVLATLQVADDEGSIVEGAWGAGDVAAVPDVYNPGKFCPPNAQHAIREGVQLAENLVATLRGEPTKEYAHKNVGTVASLGLYKGVAELFGKFKLRGPLAWAMHRGYHVMAMPTWNRKLHIFNGWVGQFVYGRETVALGAIEDPRASFRAAAVPPKPKDEPLKQEATSAAAE